MLKSELIFTIMNDAEDIILSLIPISTFSTSFVNF